jgi:hypothetical protein
MCSDPQDRGFALLSGSGVQEEISSGTVHLDHPHQRNKKRVPPSPQKMLPATRFLALRNAFPVALDALVAIASQLYRALGNLCYGSPSTVDSR